MGEEGSETGVPDGIKEKTDNAHANPLEVPEGKDAKRPNKKKDRVGGIKGKRR